MANLTWSIESDFRKTWSNVAWIPMGYWMLIGAYQFLWSTILRNKIDMLYLRNQIDMCASCLNMEHLFSWRILPKGEQKQSIV